MIDFTVVVLCANLKACPIPHGYRAKIQAETKESCVSLVKQVMGAYGLKDKEFSISCEKK